MAARNIEGAVVAITGAASGIGRATAVAFAKAGADLALSDIDVEGLEETAGLVRDLGRQVHTARLDVADRAAVHDWANEVAGHFGKVNIVINNAGVTCVAPISELSYDDLEWVMDIDFWGVVHGTKAFLPHLEQAEWGHVVNISSVFGIITVPAQGAYHAAKFAVRGFTECLRQELEMAGSAVSATSVHPGGIQTSIAANARMGAPAEIVGSKERLSRQFDAMAATTADQAGAAILKAVRKDKPRLLIGLDARFIDLAQRLLPTSYRQVTRRLGKKQLGR